MIVGKYNGNLFIKKVYQRWLEFHKLIEFIKELHSIYNPYRVLVESKASGISIQQELQRQTKYNVVGITPNGKDKITRAMSAQATCEQGKIFLVEDDWNEMFLNECASFPSGRDDMVDTLLYAIQELLQKGSGTIFK
jgi:predicted phage terminase large subunit-like protein